MPSCEVGSIFGSCKTTSRGRQGAYIVDDVEDGLARALGAGEHGELRPGVAEREAAHHDREEHGEDDARFDRARHDEHRAVPGAACEAERRTHQKQSEYVLNMTMKVTAMPTPVYSDFLMPSFWPARSDVS